MSSNLKSGSTSWNVITPPKTRIEEASIVSTQLATSRVVCDHLRSKIRWYADTFPRKKKVE